MSDHHHEKEKKKQKKLTQLFKNRHTQEINMQAATLARGRDLEKEREEEVRSSMAASSRKAKDNKPGNVVWSAKLQDIRDKNTGRKRMATERWNRFAGTAESGGRGL